MRHLLPGSTLRTIGKLFLLLAVMLATCLGLKTALDAVGKTVEASCPSVPIVLTDTAWSDDFDDASGLSALEGVQISADGQLMLASDALLGSATSVVISPTGEVQAWGRLYFTATVPLSTALAVDVLDATDAPLMHGVPSGGSLVGIDVKVYPALKLRATLSSTAAGQTPRLDEWRVTWASDYPNHVHLPVVGKSFSAPISPALGAAIGFTGVNEASSLGKTLRFPSVRKNDAGWDSTFAVQNVTAFATTLTLEFFRQDGSVAYAADGVPLQPYGTYIAALAGLASLEDGTYALAVTATETIAGMASTRYVTGTMAVAYNSITRGDERIAVPMLCKDYYGWTSRLCIHNMTPEVTDGTITYYDRSAEYVRWIDVPGNGFACIDLRQEPLPPSPFIGTALITSDTEVAVIVENVQSQGNRALGYLGFDLSAGSHTIYIPQCRNENGWQTAVQVTNVGTSTTNVTLTYHEFDGSMSYQYTPLPGFSTSFSCPGYDPWIIPPEWPLPYRLGSAVISADRSPLIALVTDVNTTSDTDGFSYAGLPVASTMAYVPNVGGGFDNWTSTLSIQNPNTTTNTVAVFLYDLSGDLFYWSSDDLPPHGMGQYDITQLSELPDSYEGSAIISATEPVAVLVSKMR